MTAYVLKASLTRSYLREEVKRHILEGKKEVELWLQTFSGFQAF